MYYLKHFNKTQGACTQHHFYCAVALHLFRTFHLIGPPWVAALLLSGLVPFLTLHAFVHCFPNQSCEVTPELQGQPYCDPWHDKGLSFDLHHLLLRFSLTCKLLSSKATFTIAFFTAINHNYDHKQWTLKHRNTRKGLKFTNHKSQTWPFELVKVKFCFLRGPLKWLTAVKHAIVSWLFNFRICLFLKSALMKWPWWRQRQWQKNNRFAKTCWQNNNFERASCFFVHFFAVTTQLRRENA